MRRDPILFAYVKLGRFLNVVSPRSMWQLLQRGPSIFIKWIALLISN
jgi:hypothetical protein